MPDLSIYRADEVAEQLDADVIYFEGPISQILAHRIISECNARRRRANVLFIMVTFGGDPNAAYRIARCFQMNYTRFLFHAPFHCKSAGTLVATGAHELVMSTGIPHIKPPGPRQRTIIDESHGSFTHECCQRSNQAHKTISRRPRLAFDGQRRRLSLRLHSPPTPPGTHLALACPRHFP